jgi:hypothetical protein
MRDIAFPVHVYQVMSPLSTLPFFPSTHTFGFYRNRNEKYGKEAERHEKCSYLYGDAATGK